MRDEDKPDDYLWDGQGTPDPEVQRLERLLAPVKFDRPAPPLPRQRGRALKVVLQAAPVWGLAAGVVLWLLMRSGPQPVAQHGDRPSPSPLPSPSASWLVEAVAGAPSCGGAGACAALPVGQWLTTDSGSRARVQVADIGWLELAPDSRLRLKATGAREHRLELAVGEIHATVDAPPRLLVVETPSATAVDLGCSYTLAVAPDGTGLLMVTSGYVSLEDPGRAAYVPAGAQAETRVGVGPGTPHFADASAPLRDALHRFDFQAGGAPALKDALAVAGFKDTLSLWNLLARVDGADRKDVIDRLEALGPAYPDGVTRALLMALDPDALQRWRDALAVRWHAW